MGVDYDFVVFGSGFSGSIMSMVLRRFGASVLMVEKGSHPRFVIGESSTPFANVLLERIGEEFDLGLLRTFSKWGSWQRHHPEIGCGLKRGFTFFHHTEGERLDPFAPEKQMLVGASPTEDVADTHWYRPEFDQFLVRAAQGEGVEYLKQTELMGLERDGKWVIEVKGRNGGRRIQAGFLIDAAGRSSALSDFCGLSERGFSNLPQTHTVYAHFRNVPRYFNEVAEKGSAPRWPYGPDDAAIHHLFGGGWIWVLHFNNGITSAGGMLTAEKAAAVGWGRVPPAEIWKKLIEGYPALKEIFRTAELSSPVYHCAGVSFRKSGAGGEGYALLPSTAGFVDPLLSTGFALTLLGVLRLGRILCGPRKEWGGKLARYSEQTLEELDATADLVSGLYASLDDFDHFRELTLLYFAALSFTESAWRLGREGLADSFLLSGNAKFSLNRRRICAASRSGQPTPRRDILEAISDFDVAGLSDQERHPWYPVRAEDLWACRGKLGASAEEVEEMLKRCG